ncbi:hypothetical protein PAPYR_8100 [Paratrimastix pyriformis]|uniref:Uncharacterized protein n=1 Tax=Paratrimastix pyriformis TaxID=342808 RepID=A0ABQ8UES1_9EUKA|nr:hypothetical protein PAPYR_8100 [Paratrimastix pyriformis]
MIIGAAQTFPEVWALLAARTGHPDPRAMVVARPWSYKLQRLADPTDLVWELAPTPEETRCAAKLWKLRDGEHVLCADAALPGLLTHPCGTHAPVSWEASGVGGVPAFRCVERALVIRTRYDEVVRDEASASASPPAGAAASAPGTAPPA